MFPQINDRLEFPVELNMYPYTKEGREATATTTSEEAGHRQDGAGNGAGDDVAKVGGENEVGSEPDV